jgi:RecA/RadA recombinase
MARKPNIQNEDDQKPSNDSIDLAKYFKTSQVKGLEMASILSQSAFSNVSEWVSTGCYSLNKIISGDIYKGLPRGRIMAFAGPSGVGKTYLLMSSAREAQKQGYTVVVFDSENAFDSVSFQRLGGNVDQVLHIPVITISELRNIGTQIIEDMMKKFPKTKLFIIVDSIGGLLTEKVFEDIEANKNASDMGIRAKQLREVAKIFTNLIAKHQAIMLVSNHTYESPPPNPKMPPTIKFGGGDGFVYATSGIIFLKKSAIKEEETDAQGNISKVKKGNILKATAEKNRFVPEGLTGEIYLSFESGLNKWYGLLNDALDSGMITEPAQGWYQFTHLETKIRKKELYKTANWTGMIDKLAEYIRNQYKYVPFTTDKELEDLSEPTDTPEETSEKE